MQTGVISSENLSQVLRGISQRRQQGVFEVNFAERQVKILFILGKVVDVRYGDIDPVADLAARLKKAGLIAEESNPNAETYQDLYRELASNGHADPSLDFDRFKWALQQLIFDRIYSLNFDAGAYFQFHVQMIEIDRDVSPSISVGQLLLDLVSLETESERFDDVFAPGLTVIAAQPSASGLSDEEQIMFDLVRGDGIPVEALGERSLLSRYHLIEALLSLYDQDLVLVAEASEDVVEEVKQPSKTATVPDAKKLAQQVDDIASVLDDVLDDALSDSVAEPDELVRLDASSTPAAREQSDSAEVEEDDEADDADHSFEPQFALDFKVRVGLWSAKLLQKSWIPHLLIVIFLAVAFIAPWLWWGDIFERFADL